MLQRHSTAWHEQLDAYIAARECQPFTWGTHDCAHFAAGWVRLARGADPLAGEVAIDNGFRAMRRVAALGGLPAAASALLGPACLGAMAQAGDVVVVDSGGRECLALCTGAQLVLPGEAGLLRLPVTEARLSWRV